jgi:hypothetical protein
VIEIKFVRFQNGAFRAAGAESLNRAVPKLIGPDLYGWGLGLTHLDRVGSVSRPFHLLQSVRFRVQQSPWFMVVATGPVFLHSLLIEYRLAINIESLTIRSRLVHASYGFGTYYRETDNGKTKRPAKRHRLYNEQ